MHTRRAMTLAVVAAALLLGACGTTDDNGADTTTTTSTTVADQSSTTTSSTTTTTTIADSPTTEQVDEEAAARAEATNLVAEDFSAEWTSEPHEDSGEPNLIEVCAPDVDLEGTTVAKSDSDDFAKGDTNTVGQQIQSSTRVFEDEAAATEAVSVFSDAAFVACADANLKEEIPGEVTGNLEGQEALAYGDQAEAIVGTLTVTTPTAPEPQALEVAILAIRTGDIATVLTGLSVGGPVDEIFPSLADAVAQRQTG